MQKFDVFIPCAFKDYVKLPYVMDAIRRNIVFGGTIHVSIPFDVTQWIFDNVMFHRDKDVLDIDMSMWKFRPSWMYQQCLKLFQEVTSDLYLVVDCDTIINRPIQFFEGEKKIWYTGWNQFNKPYFDFQEKLIGIGKVCPDSCIADIGFYDRGIINEMVTMGKYCYNNKYEFIKYAQSITTPDCYMCEQDLYGSYCYKNHQDEYVFKPLMMGGIKAKIQHNPNVTIWEKDEIEDQIKKMSKKDCDTFSMHSWYVESQGQPEGKERL